MTGITPEQPVRIVLDMWEQQPGGEMMGTITRKLLASVLFLLIMLGWLGDSLLSVLIGRPKLSFREVYKSWKHHQLMLLAAK
jgi:hypothetical protein